MESPARFFLFVVCSCCLIISAAQGVAQAGQTPVVAGSELGSNAALPGGSEVWQPESVVLPVFGVIRLADFSLPALAVLLGLADGFNPCAMWALVYLLSLLVSLRDRRKIWLLVGSFVLASGVLYFLFMTAWLNAFLLLGYLRPLTLAIGAMDLRAFILPRGAPVCAVGSPGLKKRTMGRMERLVAAPLSLAAFTLRTTMAGGYARYGKLVGGLVLMALGLVMLLAPETLR